jgi:hypothetical protein
MADAFGSRGRGLHSPPGVVEALLGTVFKHAKRKGRFAKVERERGGVRIVELEYGYIYDVKTGRLNEVKAATEAGKAKAA